MIDNEKIKAIIKLYADKGKKMYSETINSRGSRYNAGFWDGYECCAKGLLRELEDMQEVQEPRYPSFEESQGECHPFQDIALNDNLSNTAMTDKEKLDKMIAEIERRNKEVSNRITELGNTVSYRYGLFDLKEFYKKLLFFFDSMQKESTSVWHDAKEEPQTDRQILLVMKNGNKKILTHYGCNEYCIDCVWVKLSEQNKWAYIDDLLKL